MCEALVRNFAHLLVLLVILFMVSMSNVTGLYGFLRDIDVIYLHQLDYLRGKNERAGDAHPGAKGYELPLLVGDDISDTFVNKSSDASDKEHH